MLFAAINSGMQQALLVFHTRSRDCRYLEFFIKSTKRINCRRVFLHGNFECKFHTLINPNHEQLRKLQLCIDSVAAI